MKPESWQQLDKLFHSALERKPEERAAFLDESCAGDEALRKQVAALLHGHENAESFIEKPALGVAARLLADEQADSPTVSLIGHTIGHYVIIALLGSGGMGEVYLAQDTSLGRKVALKLLPGLYTQDADRLRRFEQEARTASALNHPNIITIYEIGHTAAMNFIATEYLDGVTLRAHLAMFRVTTHEALDIAVQVSSALAAAHTKGVVHRDIKPENIMVLKEDYSLHRENYVKVLDFGIAKLTESSKLDTQAPTKPLINTNQGVVLGTASYMSPEQARAIEVDSRTDIWSLGVVLYEMLAGKLPFEGKTAEDMRASILKDKLPALSAEIPERLKWTVEKALRKDREDRYQTAREFFSDLRELQQHAAVSEVLREHSVTPEASVAARSVFRQPDAEQVDRTREVIDHEPAVTTKETHTRSTSRAEHIVRKIKGMSGRGIIILAAVVIALAGVTFGLYKFNNWNQSQTIGKNQIKPALPFQGMKMSRLTSTGKATHAAISPDGKYVVHVVDDGEQQSLWMRQVSTSSNVQINPPANLIYHNLTFSRGGDYLYYVAWDKKNPFSLYQMPVLGGASRKLVSDIDSVVTFSPDGKQFAFLRGYPSQGELALVVANADGTAERKVAASRIPNWIVGNPTWSPDGKVIIYPAESTDSNGKTLLEVQVGNGLARPISSLRWRQIDSLTWLRDGSGLIFTTREGIASPSQIWYLSYPDGQARRITNDLNDYLDVSLTADSAVLSTVKSEQVSNIWIVSSDDAHGASQISYSNLDGAAGISWSPDGKIVYASGASNLDLWIMKSDGTEQKRLTADAGNNHSPSVSPDGRYIVFISDRTGTNHVWRIDIDGSNARQLTNGESEWSPQCSPSGQWVVYASGFGKESLWKVPIDGGDAVQIVDKTSAGVAISPDGNWIASAQFEPSAIKTAIYPVEGGEPQKVLDIISLFVRWTPNGRALAYLDQKDLSNISIQTIDGGIPKQLTNFKPGRVFSFAWSRDGQQLAIARGAVNSDVVLITNFKDQQ